MFSNEVQQSIQEEFERGYSARSRGNEGRARVCARRAAGTALREYLRLSGQFGQVTGSGSAYSLFGAIQELDQIPSNVKEAAQHLQMQVDVNHNLPGQVDLLEDARCLADELGKLI